MHECLLKVRGSTFALSTVSTIAKLGTPSTSQLSCQRYSTASCFLGSKADFVRQCSAPIKALALLDCKWPMKCHCMSSGNWGALSSNSCAQAHSMKKPVYGCK